MDRHYAFSILGYFAWDYVRLGGGLEGPRKALGRSGETGEALEDSVDVPGQKKEKMKQRKL